MGKKQIPFLLAVSILLVSCTCPLTDLASRFFERQEPVEEPFEILMSIASEVPPEAPTPTIKIEPSATNTLEPMPASTATPTKQVIIDDQNAFLHRANLARTGAYPNPGPKEVPTLLWEFEAGDSIYSAPVVFEGVAYFGSYDGSFYAIDTSTGAMLWRFTTGGPVVSSPALADGLLYFGSNDGNLYALEAASGEVHWAFETGDRVVSSPAVADGLVYFGSDDGFLYALDAQTGEEAWAFEVAGVADANSGVYKTVNSSPAISDGVVFFGSSQVGGASAELFFYALDSQTGEKLWEFTEWNQLTSPAVYEGVAYFGGFASFYGVEIATGSLVLDVPTDIINTAPAIYDGVAYFGTENGLLFAIDLELGEVIWTFESGSWSLKAPSIADGVVYAGSGEGLLWALDHQTGQMLWEYQLDEGLSTPAVIHDGVIYVGVTGHLFALE